MISIICFSKDRPLQIEAYIQSVLFYSGLPPSALSILYTDSDFTSYSGLLKKYPQVNWVRETHFHTDLIGLVDKANDTILLGCDDVFFTDHFDFRIPQALLVNDPDLFGFSLRLGLNLNLGSMPKLRFDGELLEWEWSSALGGHWDYPWDVSASIYRREFISAYLKTTPDAINPNRFEFYLANSCRESWRNLAPKLASFKRSKCLTLTINRVQDEFPNEFDGSIETDIQTLYNAHKSGRQLDWPKFHLVSNRVIHVDSSYFQLANSIIEPPLLKKNTLYKFINVLTSNMQLSMRLFFWRSVNKFKASLHPWIRSKMKLILKNYSSN